MKKEKKTPGRPKIPAEKKRVPIDFTLSPEIVRAGKIAAKAEGMSFSAWTERARRAFAVEQLGTLNRSDGDDPQPG